MVWDEVQGKAVHPGKWLTAQGQGASTGLDGEGNLGMLGKGRVA